MADPELPTGRLAPSPTGLLHLGHARSFLLAWWQVRARGGRCLLRMEDLDQSRVRPGMADACLRDLEWLGLDWDGPVLVQSEGHEQLHAAVEDLLSAGVLYPCVCTRREIRQASSAPHAEDGTTRYPGTCRGRFETLAEARAHADGQAALRLRVDPGTVQFTDGYRGAQSVDVAAEVGDFPVTGRDGQVAYQLAVVVDDARSGVDTLLRGDDLLASTARQVLLQRALGLPAPSWFHVPLVCDPDGRRLAKRRDDLSLASLRTAGVDPNAVVAWAARTAGQACSEPASPAELLEEFDLGALPPAPVVLDPQSLEFPLS
jgi:glutamyl-tRNA synthetase